MRAAIVNTVALIVGLSLAVAAFVNHGEAQMCQKRETARVEFCEKR